MQHFDNVLTVPDKSLDIKQQELANNDNSDDADSVVTAPPEQLAQIAQTIDHYKQQQQEAVENPEHVVIVGTALNESGGLKPTARRLAWSLLFLGWIPIASTLLFLVFSASSVASTLNIAAFFGYKTIAFGIFLQIYCYSFYKAPFIHYLQFLYFFQPMLDLHLPLYFSFPAFLSFQASCLPCIYCLMCSMLHF